MWLCETMMLTLKYMAIRCSGFKSLVNFISVGSLKRDTQIFLSPSQIPSLDSHLFILWIKSHLHYKPLHKDLSNRFLTGVTAFDSLSLDLLLHCAAGSTIVSDQQLPFLGLMYRQVVHHSQYVYLLSRLQGFCCGITIIRCFQDLARWKHAYPV